MPDLQVTSGVVNAMAKAARQALPLEACGLLLGRENRIEELRLTVNVAPDPTLHFEIDPAELIAAYKAERAGGARVVGYFHSHPRGPARPSETDRAEAARDGRIWVIADASGAMDWFVSGKDGFVPVTPVILADSA